MLRHRMSFEIPRGLYTQVVYGPCWALEHASITIPFWHITAPVCWMEASMYVLIIFADCLLVLWQLLVILLTFESSSLMCTIEHESKPGKE